MRRKLVLFLAFCILVSGSAFAYELEGSSAQDDSSSSQDTYFFDLDAAWTFSNGEPGTTGPSVFYGEEVVKYQDGSVANTWEDQPNGDGSIIKNYVSGGEGLDNWGDGERQQTRISISDSVVRSNYKNIEYLVAPPHPDASQTENRCGDTVHNDGNDALSCPEDYGMPSDADDTESESSDASSEQSLSFGFINYLGETEGDANYDINDLGSISGVGDSGDTTAERILYDPSFTYEDNLFSAKEHNSPEDDNIDGPNVGSLSEVVYEDENWENVPDFYQADSENEIWMKFVRLSGDTSIEDPQNPVQTVDLTTGTYDENYQPTRGNIDTSCTASGNYTCETGSTEYCVDTNDRQLENHQITTEDITLEADNPRHFQTDTAPGNGIDAYTESSDTGFEVTVTRNIKDGTEPFDAHQCTEWETDDYCSLDGNADSGSSCSTGSTEGLYSNQLSDETRGDDSRGGQGVYYDGWDTHSRDYRYQTLEFDEAKIFDTNPAENPAGAPSHPADALFWDDSYKTNSGANTVNYGVNTRENHLSILPLSNTGYYSWEIDQNPNPLSNDPAVSISSFSIDVDGTNFHSVRDSFETYDADGPYGESDGYVAIRHDVNNEGTASESKDDSDFQIVGTTPLFTDQETTTDGSSTNFVNYDPGSQPGWLSGCPRDQIKCVASVDLSLQNIENWDSPSPDGGDVITTQTDTYAIDKSLSVCKMYENLAGSDGYDLDNFQSTSCQFTGGPGGGGGGTCDEDPSECDTGPGTRMHTMEGPEVNEDRFSGALEDPVKDDYKTRVDHSDCVYKGEDVSEGTVANIASESYSGYEAGTDSPDWEVCLNIHDAGPYDDVDNGYHDTGAHEFGGQWYDLDDSRVDYYLRPGNDGGESDQDGVGHSLIEDATEDQRNNASHISYYYRKNPNPYHPEWNPRGFTTSGGERDYYYGLAIEQDCDQDLDGCDDSGKTESDSAGIEQQFHYTFLWKNHGTTVEDYANVRGPPL